RLFAPGDLLEVENAHVPGHAAVHIGHGERRVVHGHEFCHGFRSRPFAWRLLRVAQRSPAETEVTNSPVNRDLAVSARPSRRTERTAGHLLLTDGDRR